MSRINGEHYLVSYYAKTDVGIGFGNVEITVKKYPLSIDEIRGLEHELQVDNIRQVVILSIQRLK